MRSQERIVRWLDDLESALNLAAELIDRGREAYDSDVAVSLAFEALSNSIGDLAKRLTTAEPERFSAMIWRQAARQRDFVVHHYDRLDADLLWRTATHSFPELAVVVRVERAKG